MADEPDPVPSPDPVPQDFDWGILGDYLEDNGHPEWAARVRANRWIPIGESMPEEWAEVLVSTALGQVFQGYWHTSYAGDEESIHWNQNGVDGYAIDDVTHWQPMPRGCESVPPRAPSDPGIPERSDSDMTQSIFPPDPDIGPMSHVRRAESRLWHHLANRVKAPWFVTTLGGISREDRKPTIHVRVTLEGLDAAKAWADAEGGRWEGIRLQVVRNPGY